MSRHPRRDRAHTAGRGRDRECCQCGRTRARLRTYDANALGGKVEYRFNPKLSLQVGTDPPTSALYCRSNYSLGSLVETPRQWGLSILRTWHF